jgi:endoglucanase
LVDHSLMSIWCFDKLATRRPRPRAMLALLALAALGVLAMVAGPAASARPRAQAAYAQRCDDPFSSTRDPSNPLALPVAPGANPLTGARFYVPGPAHGAAASAIARLVGLNPANIPSDESWASFEQDLTSGPLSHRLSGSLAYKVHQLSIIASQPEAQRFSIYSGGGGPGAIFLQVQKILCRNMEADPGSIPIINTYFLHPALGGCSTAREIGGESPVFRRQVGELAEGIARRPAVLLLELDAIGSSVCMAKNGGLAAWEADLRYEINQVSVLPHTVVYVEAGYSDANSPSYTAKILNAIGVRQIRGFFTNDTHMNWTINEVHWAEKISAKTGGADFIVNTAQNGNGPKANRHPVTQGNENLCNPPGRALGPMDTTNTGFRHADAYLWTHPPGNSSGCGGGPPSGVFYPSWAVGLASRANQKLGPGFPNRPY